jgi:predicted ATPase
MKYPLKKLSVNGFKSIRSLDIELKNFNVLVGANGAGKSNFVDFFRMLRAMSEEGLQEFVLRKGGADGFFFEGPKQTPEVSAHLYFGENEYRFSLAPTSSGLMLKSEEIMYTPKGSWQYEGSAQLESGLKTWKDKASRWGPWKAAEAHVYEAVSNWIVYHFHDTSLTAPMRREQPVRDNRQFNSNASNVAAFLYNLRESYPQSFDRIRLTIQLVAPFFDEFLLGPELKGENEVIRLEWRQKGSSFPFQPWQFSDGTIRFICLATALLQPNPPSTIVIDEPELGLHPFALDVLAGLMREAAERTQLVVSTQSVSLLNHFSPDDIIIVDRESGASTFHRLDEKSLASWLEEYSLGELWQKNVIDGGPRSE